MMDCHKCGSDNMRTIREQKEKLLRQCRVCLNTQIERKSESVTSLSRRYGCPECGAAKLAQCITINGKRLGGGYSHLRRIELIPDSEMESIGYSVSIRKRYSPNPQKD